MENTLKKLTINDLRIGMQISSKDELSNIYDTWIILYKSPESKIWTIGFIGENIDEQNDEAYRNNGYDICPVFNDSIDLEGDTYDEE